MRAITITIAALAMLFAASSLAHAKAPAQGDLVLAVWGPDGHYYPARVATVDGGDLKVAYYDGDVAVVSGDKVRDFDWKAGTTVQCNWKNGGKYFPGKIAKMEGEVVFIHYDDGDREEAGIGRCRSK